MDMKKYKDFLFEGYRERLEEFLKEFEQSDKQVAQFPSDIRFNQTLYEDVREDNFDFDQPIFNLKDKYKDLNIVIGFYWAGGFDVVLQKLKKDSDNGLGSSSDHVAYLLNYADTVLSPYDVINNIKVKPIVPDIRYSEADPYGAR